METIKKWLKNPLISRLWWIGIGTVFTFALVLGGYKESFETMQDDVKFTKDVVQEIQIDVAVLKATQKEIYK